MFSLCLQLGLKEWESNYTLAYLRDAESTVLTSFWTPLQDGLLGDLANKAEQAASCLERNVMPGADLSACSAAAYLMPQSKSLSADRRLNFGSEVLFPFKSKAQHTVWKCTWGHLSSLQRMDPPSVEVSAGGGSPCCRRNSLYSRVFEGPCATLYRS